MQQVAEVALLIAAGYLGVGLVIAALFHGALARLDPAARGAGLRFRLLITPGLIGLWPIVLRRWLIARGGGSLHAETERVAIGSLRALHGPLVIASLGAGIATLTVAALAAPTSVRAPALDLPGTPLTLTAAAGVTLDPDLRASLTRRGATRRVSIAIPMSTRAPGLAFYWRETESGDLKTARFLGTAGRSGVRDFELPSSTTTTSPGVLLITHGLDPATLAVARLPAQP